MKYVWSAAGLLMVASSIFLGKGNPTFRVLEVLLNRVSYLVNVNKLKRKLTNQINNQSIIPSTDIIQLTLTLKMTTAQVVETSVTVNNNRPIQDYVHPDDQTQPTFQSFTYTQNAPAELHIMYDEDIKQVSSGSTNHELANFFMVQSMSTLATDNRKQVQFLKLNSLSFSKR